MRKKLLDVISAALVIMLSSFCGNMCLAGGQNKHTDLSASGTANCYIIAEAGDYGFRADVKGNSTVSLDGTPASVRILWETDGLGKPAGNRLIRTASLKLTEGYVSFSTSRPFKDGNALIAVLDASGTVLWSWHIWLCKGFDADATAQEYANSAGVVMDRNLGATSAATGDAGASGLHFQWGRKDPFPANCTNLAAADFVIDGADNLAFSIAYPTTFIFGTSWPFDWYCTCPENRNDELWSSVKTVYDPCPAGWQVPRGDKEGLWCTAFGNTYYDWSYAGDWDEEHKGMDFAATHNRMGSGPAIWYPAAGCRNCLSGELQGYGDQAYYWSSTPMGSYAYCLGFFYFGSTVPYGHLTRAYGLSIRCQRESR